MLLSRTLLLVLIFFYFNDEFVHRSLKGAHNLRLEKPIKQECGGGYKIFLFDELEFYEGAEWFHILVLKKIFVCLL